MAELLPESFFQGKQCHIKFLKENANNQAAKKANTLSLKKQTTKNNPAILQRKKLKAQSKLAMQMSLKLEN